LAAEAAQNASRGDIATLHESIARLQAVARDPGLFRDEAQRFMSLIAAASGNRVLAILVEALHRMPGESGSWWDENECRSAVRSYGRTVEAIEGGHSDEARSIMAKSLASAQRRTAPAAHPRWHRLPGRCPTRGEGEEAVREITAIQMALPADTELWLGGADARRAAADIQAFRGWVLDDLNTIEAELARIAAGAPRSA